MPETPRQTLGDLAHRALATADAADRVALVAQLARGTRTPDQLSAVADLFLAGGSAGRAAFLEWVGRVRADLPPPIRDAILPMLSDRSVPVSARVVGAARLLRSRPDRPSAVRPVTRALTRRYSPLRALERLRQLQHQLEVSEALDALIELRERRVKMDCPRCGVRLPRMEMVRHLWHAHGLTLAKRKVRTPAWVVAAAKGEHERTLAPDALDRGFLVAGAVARRAWVASSDPSVEETAALRAAAEERGAGLCPGCFAELRPPVVPLPQPLVIADGRLAGGGYEVRVGGSEWFRTVGARTPNGEKRTERMALGPRGAGTVAALPLLCAALLAACVAPEPNPLAPLIVLCSAAAYLLARFLRHTLPTPDDHAVDVAWDALAGKLVAEQREAAFLTRLCRTSIGRGDHVERVGVLNAILKRADAGPWDLLAAARVLQVEDGGRFGRDRVAGIAALAAPAFKGEVPTDYADHVVGCFLGRGPTVGELGRLRVLLIAAAFDAGVRPRALIDLWGVAPHLRRAMIVEPMYRLGLLAGVWATRDARPWEPVGKGGVKGAARGVAAADSVFDLCRSSPNVSGRVLAEFPDLLLYHVPEESIELEVGPVLVCARGVAVGGFLVADPDAVIEVVKGGRFGAAFELVFGPHRVRLSKKLPESFLLRLREWLRFRAEVLLPHIDAHLEPGERGASRRLVGPYSAKCAACGTVSAVAVGKVGMRV